MSYSIDRRTMLLGALAACHASVGRADGVRLHEAIAARARALAQEGTPHLRMLAPLGCEANLHPIIRAFQERTGIGLTLRHTTVDTINARISLDWLSQKMDYDLALPATFGLPDLASSGAFRALGDFQARYEPPGFRDGMLFQAGDSFDGQTYGFQTDGDAYVMFYNDTFLADHREQSSYEERFSTPLEMPLTWSELDRQIEWFARPDADMWGGALFRTSGYVGWEWWVRFHAKGLWPLDEDLRPLIAGDAGVEALEDLIRVTDFLKPGVSHFGLVENWKNFAAGDVYCNIGWGGSQKHFNGPDSKVKGKLRYGPTPGGIVDGQLLVTPYFNWGWTMAVTSTSQNAELAYLFALFASTPDVSAEAVSQQGGFFDPHRQEHYQDPVIRGIYSDAFLKVHAASMRNAIPDLYLANQSQYLGALNKWIVRALDGDVTAKEAMKRVAQSWELTTLRSDPQRQRQRWRDLRSKYPAQVKARLRSDLS